MAQEDKDTNFPIHVDSKLINTLQKIISYGLKVLACLMCTVILWTIADLTLYIFKTMVEPPYLTFTLEEILATFGSFLIVLIAIEIFINIILYFKKNTGHVRLVLATALMAIARKVIILDYDNASNSQLFAIGAVIAALAVAYLLVIYANNKLESSENTK